MLFPAPFTLFIERRAGTCTMDQIRADHSGRRPRCGESRSGAAQYPNGDPAVARAFVPSMTKSPRHIMPRAVRVNS
jgi:hypothetical protein